MEITQPDWCSNTNFIGKLRANNWSISRVCSILGVGSNTPQAPLRKETIRSVCAKIAQENMREDLGKTMQILEDMRARDNELSVKFKIDSEGKLTSMLWWTGKNKEDYKRFADAITFDTTYRTTLQAPFWFVCRSKQSFSVCYLRRCAVDNWDNRRFWVLFYKICGDHGRKGTTNNAYR